jgi:hypothetical protein
MSKISKTIKTREKGEKKNDLEKTLKRIEKRLDKLEAVSHKQPDMKKMLRDASEVLKYQSEKEQEKKIMKKLDAREKRKWDSIKRIKRKPGFRC